MDITRLCTTKLKNVLASLGFPDMTFSVVLCVVTLSLSFDACYFIFSHTVLSVTVTQIRNWLIRTRVQCPDIV